MHLYIRRKHQSNLIAPQLQVNPETTVTFQKDRANKTASRARLMSISSDLQKNVLPSVHNQINQIYKKRLTKYLNLVAIHGERNQQIVNSIYSGRKIDDDELARLQKEVTLARLRQRGFSPNRDINLDSSGIIPVQKLIKADHADEFLQKKPLLAKQFVLTDLEEPRSIVHQLNSPTSNTQEFQSPINSLSQNHKVFSKDTLSLPNSDLISSCQELTQRDKTEKTERNEKVEKHEKNDKQNCKRKEAVPSVYKKMPNDPIERIKFKAGIRSMRPSSPNADTEAERSNPPTFSPNQRSQDENRSQIHSRNAEPNEYHQSVDKQVPSLCHVPTQSESVESESNQHLKLEATARLPLTDRLPIQINNEQDVSQEQLTSDAISQLQLQAKPANEELNILEFSTQTQQWKDLPPKFSKNNDISKMSNYSTGAKQDDKQYFRMYQDHYEHHNMSKGTQAKDNFHEKIKKIKTYELHLPMHHIQEEGSRGSDKHPSTIYRKQRATKQHQGNDKRNEMSSQGLDVMSTRDLRNSQQQFLSKDVLHRSSGKVGRNGRSHHFFHSVTHLQEKDKKRKSAELKSLKNEATTLIAHESYEKNFPNISDAKLNQKVDDRIRVEFGEQALQKTPGFRSVKLGTNYNSSNDEVVLQGELLMETDFIQWAQQNFDLMSKEFMQLKKTPSGRLIRSGTNMAVAKEGIATTEDKGISVLNIGSSADPEDLQIFRISLESAQQQRLRECSSPYSTRVILPMKQHDIGLKKVKPKDSKSKTLKINRMFKQPGFKKSQKYFIKDRQFISPLNNQLGQHNMKLFKAPNGGLCYLIDEPKATENKQFQPGIPNLAELVKNYESVSNVFPLYDKVSTLQKIRNSVETTLQKSQETGNQPVQSAACITMGHGTVQQSQSYSLDNPNAQFNRIRSEHVDETIAGEIAISDSFLASPLIPSTVLPHTIRNSSSDSDSEQNKLIALTDVVYCRTQEDHIFRDKTPSEKSSVERRVISLHHNSKQAQVDPSFISHQESGSPKAIYYKSFNQKPDFDTQIEREITFAQESPQQLIQPIQLNTSQFRPEKIILRLEEQKFPQAAIHSDERQDETLWCPQEDTPINDISKFTIKSNAHKDVEEAHFQLPFLINNPLIKKQTVNNQKKTLREQEKTVLRNIKEKRNIRIEGSVLKQNVTQLQDSEGGVRLMNGEIIQLVDAFFRSSDNEERLTAKGFANAACNTRRKNKSQQQSRGRRVIQTQINGPHKIEHEKRHSQPACIPQPGQLKQIINNDLNSHKLQRNMDPRTNNGNWDFAITRNSALTQRFPVSTLANGLAIANFRGASYKDSPTQSRSKITVHAVNLEEGDQLFVTKSKNPVLVKLPISGYTRLQGGNGELITGLDHALNHINPASAGNMHQ